MKGIYYTVLILMALFGIGMATYIGLQSRWTGNAYWNALPYISAKRSSVCTIGKG